MATEHTFAGPTAGSYTLTDREMDRQTDLSKVKHVIYADEQSMRAETSNQMQYTKYADRETANTPVFGVSSFEQSLISLLSASVFISAAMSSTHTHNKCSLVVNNHTVASQIIFTDS